jgi:hypothetical protein
LNSFYELLTVYISKIFSKIYINLDFNISKLIFFTDTFGSLLGLNLVKNAIIKKLRIPDSLIMIHPLSEVNQEDIEDIDVGFYKTEYDILIHFPDCYIISPYNSPYKENSEKLYNFLITNKVSVTFQQDISYNRSCFQYPTLYENNSAIEFTYSYLVKVLKSEHRRGSNLSTVPNSP